MRLFGYQGHRQWKLSRYPALMRTMAKITSEYMSFDRVIQRASFFCHSFYSFIYYPRKCAESALLRNDVNGEISR
jgi:hypothetical protein